MPRIRLLFLYVMVGVSAGGLTGCASSMSSCQHYDETPIQYVCGSLLTCKVKMKLRESQMLKDQIITVTTYKDVVQLSGFVDSACQKRRAVALACQVKGVREVKDALIVKKY